MDVEGREMEEVEEEEVDVEARKRELMWDYISGKISELGLRVMVDRVEEGGGLGGGRRWDGEEWQERSWRRRIGLARRYWRVEMDWRMEGHNMETEDWPWERAVERWWRLREKEETDRMEEEDGRWESWSRERWRQSVRAEVEFLWRYRRMAEWGGERWKKEDAVVIEMYRSLLLFVVAAHKK